LSTGQQKKLSTIQVARMLGVAVSSISKWIDEGKLVGGRTPGGHRRIEADDLVRFLKEQKLRIPAELRPSPAKVLIVDDEKPFTDWLSEEISDRYPELEVMVAHEGYSAGEIVGLVKPDVILLDLHMPGIDGFEVCRRIKANPLIKHIRVIAVTADASADTRSRILRLGACTCLAKPLDAVVILGEIAKVLGLPV